MKMLTRFLVPALFCALLLPRVAAAAAAAPEDKSLTPQVSGGLSLDAVRKVVQAAGKSVSKCYDDRRKADASLQGKVTLSFTIGIDGAPAAPALDKKQSTLADEALVACVTGVIKGLKFAAASSATSVTYPFVFARADAGAKEVAALDDAGGHAKHKDAAKPASEPRAPAGSASVGGVGTAATSDGGGTSVGYGGGGAGYGRGGRGEGERKGAPSAAPSVAAPESSGAPASRAAPGDSGSSTRLSTGSPAPAPPPSEHRRDKKAEERYDESAASDAVASRTAGPSKGASAGEAAAAAPRAISAPALKAGRYDDNKQYNRFLEFLQTSASAIPYKVNVSERLVIKVSDVAGKSMPNCKLDVKSGGGKVLATSTTYADGTTHFFPADASTASDKDYILAATCGGATRQGQLARAGRRTSEIRFESARTIPAHVPVDIAIVIDTTGSMQNQIDRLKSTLQSIHYALTQLSTKPDIRFGLVAYRDRGDDYVTQVSPFTSSIEAFQSKLDKLQADGGGDEPEDLQSGLASAMHELEWRGEALRLGFAISDAPPHTDYGQKYTYADAMREALKRGIKWVMVGAGGLPPQGEVVFRQISEFSMGEYVFVTESGGGDTDGGVGEASHHVGANYATENLDQAIVRIVRRELSYLTEEPRDFDYTITAAGTKTTPRDEVLAPAVAEVLRQLADYSAIKLAAKTPVAVVPVTADVAYKEVTGYLNDQFILAASRNPSFKVLERDLKALAQELKLQLSDLFDVKETVAFGKMVGAEALIVAKLNVIGDSAELYAKLVRVETGEVLSAAKVKIAALPAGS